VNAELGLELGKYIVIFKITGERGRAAPTKNQAVLKTRKYNRKKFLQIGMSVILPSPRLQQNPRMRRSSPRWLHEQGRGKKSLLKRPKPRELIHPNIKVPAQSGVGSQQGRDVGGDPLSPSPRAG